MANNDRSLNALFEELNNATCGRSKNTARTVKLLNSLQKTGDLRAIGPILALAQKSAACQSKALATASAILGNNINLVDSEEQQNK